MKLPFLFTLSIFIMFTITSCKEDNKVNNSAKSEAVIIADTIALNSAKRDNEQLKNDSLKSVLSKLSVKQLKKEYLPILKKLDDAVLLLQRVQLMIQQQNKNSEEPMLIKKIMITEGNAIKFKNHLTSILDDYSKINPAGQNQNFQTSINNILNACKAPNASWDETCFGNTTATACQTIIDSWLNEIKKAQNDIINKTIK